jgi:hypothetical protein
MSSQTHAAEARHQTLDDLLYGCRPSMASRTISRKSRASGRSIIPALMAESTVPRMIQCESFLEAKTVLALLVHRDVVSIIEQPPAVNYFDEAHLKWKTHTFDLFVKTSDGTKIAIAVRAFDRAEKLKPIVTAIAKQVFGFADFYCLVTDANLPTAMVRNARRIISARKDVDRSADEEIRSIIKTLHGTTTVGSLIAATGLEGNAFRAIVRLIDAGELEIDHNVLIDYPAKIRRPLNARAAA